MPSSTLGQRHELRYFVYDSATFLNGLVATDVFTDLSSDIRWYLYERFTGLATELQIRPQEASMHSDDEHLTLQ